MRLINEFKSLLHRGQKSEAPKASDELNILGQVTEQEWDNLMSMQIYIDAAENGPNQYANGGAGADVAEIVTDLVKYKKEEFNKFYDSTLKKYGFTRDTHRIIEDRKIVSIEDYGKFMVARDKINATKIEAVKKWREKAYQK